MKNIYMNLKLYLIATSLMFIACQKSNDSFSLISEQNSFTQGQGLVVNNKIDIIWMIDGSGTMANHQTNLANNFGNFINGFVSKGYDYHMVVASTDAWLREVNYNGGTCNANPNPSNNPNTLYISSADCQNTLASFGQLTHFRDGDIYGAANGTPATRSGIYMLTNLMDSSLVSSIFGINIKTGVRGDGTREGALASLRSVLRRNSDGSIGYNGETHTELTNFRRKDAFLAVIIVSDEEDQSRKQDNTTYSTIEEYVNSFIGFMDGYTGGVEGNRKYNVSGIVLEDINNCTYGLHAQATQGNRYVAIANASKGISKSICSADFSSELSEISEKIVTLATRFQLTREPVVDSIKISVNGTIIPPDAQNGWVYVTENGFYYIEFHGTSIPQQDTSIDVTYDPVTVIQ